MPIRSSVERPDHCLCTGHPAGAARQATRQSIGQWGARHLLIWLMSLPIRLYRYLLSPWIMPRCRYLPTCSEYADRALERHGLWAGGWMTLARLLRCHPWGNSGLDYVPDVPPRNASWYLPWRYGRWRGTNPAP